MSEANKPVTLVCNNKRYVPSYDQHILTAAIEGASLAVAKVIEDIENGDLECANPHIPNQEPINIYAEAWAEVAKVISRSAKPEFPVDDIPF